MAVLEYVLMIVLFLLAIFLTVLVLIQRGKGGGLAGALGGMWGQSAFGTKAGDLFTRITIGVAIAWIVLCIVSVKVLSVSGERLDLGAGASTELPASSTEGSEPSGAPAGGESGGGAAPAAPASSDDAAKN